MALLPQRARPTPDLRASMIDSPGAILRFLFSRLFAAIHFGEAEAERIRGARARGPIVYVLRTVSYIEYLYFNYALARHGLPLARFANGGMRTIFFWPLKIVISLLLAIWRLAHGPTHEETGEMIVARRLGLGDAVLLFLRPHFRLLGDRRAGAAVRGRFMETLFAAQDQLSARGLSIQVVPMTLIWGYSPVRSGARSAIDLLFGDPETPGRLRGLWRFVRHHRSSIVKVAEPIDLRAFLEGHEGRSEDALARTLRFEASGRIEKERRAVLGPPAKNARRMREEVLRSRRLSRTIAEIAAQTGVERASLERRAARMLREIAAKPKPWAISGVRTLLESVFARIYDGIDVDDEGLDRVRAAAKMGPLLLLPSHRSHVDYLVLSSVFYGAGLPVPHIAAGANLSFFPLGWLFRRCAAFFLRRSFKGDPLYSAVFAAYVRRLLRNGLSIEFFIEGGRSRTGKLLAPKLGLLGIVAEAVTSGEAPNIQVVPVAITYEKVVEEGSYAHELAGGEKRKEDIGALIRAGRVLLSKYGRIDLKIGRPFSLAQALAKGTGRTAMRRLGNRVLYEIARTTTVTPRALVAASCMATVTRAIPRAELSRRVRWLAACARANGIRFAAALEADFPSAIDRAVDLLASDDDLELRGMGEDALIVIPDENRPRLEYYKNNAIHALAEASIVARAILASQDFARRAALDDVKKSALLVSRILKNELTYRPNARFDEVLGTVLGDLAKATWIETGPEGECHVTDMGAVVLPVLSGLTTSYLLAYRLAIQVVLAFPKLSGKERVAKVASFGERALLLGDLSRREALLRPVFESALEYLRDEGAIVSRERLVEMEREITSVLVGP